MFTYTFLLKIGDTNSSNGSIINEFSKGFLDMSMIFLYKRRQFTSYIIALDESFWNKVLKVIFGGHRALNE